MNPVVQLDRTGCAIASVAARMGMSYPDMKSLARSLGVTPEDNALWTSTSSIKWKIHDGIRPVTGSCLSERTRVRLSWIRKKDFEQTSGGISDGCAPRYTAKASSPS